MSAAVWPEYRLDQLFQFREELADGTEPLVSAFITGEVTLRSNKPGAIIKNSGKELGYKRAYPGDLVISGMNAHLGGLGISDSYGKCSPVYIVLEPKAQINQSFFYYHLRHLAVSGKISSLTNTIRFNSADFKRSDVKNIFVPLPEPSEQERIANFLDEKTARIDALIAEKARLANSIGEHFISSLISEISTGGHRKQLKASGLPWAAYIPNHWSTPKISHVFKSIGSGTTPATDDELAYGPGTPWVTSSELREGVINTTAKEVTELAIAKYSALRVHPAGSVLMAMYGATIGRLGVLGVDATVNQACCALSGPEGVLSDFAFYALWAMREHILITASGGGQPNINQDKVRGFRIPLPLL